MQAADLGFEFAHDPWELYLGKPPHGSLGYEDSHAWDILQLRHRLRAWLVSTSGRVIETPAASTGLLPRLAMPARTAQAVSTRARV